MEYRAGHYAERDDEGNENGVGFSQGTQEVVEKQVWSVKVFPFGKKTQPLGLPAKVTDPLEEPHSESHSEDRRHRQKAQQERHFPGWPRTTPRGTAAPHSLTGN